MKKFTLKVLTIVLVIIALVMCYNYKYDTYGVYNKDFSVPRVEPNQHFVKIEYLIENPSKYNAYCFGSSRVGNIDLKKIHNGYNYYNMTYSEGVPGEWLEDINILLKHHVAIKQVMIGIDDFSFRVEPQRHNNQYLRMPYKENNIYTYISYLLKPPSKPSYDTNSMSLYDIYDSGRPLHTWADDKIESDVESHIHGKAFSEGSPYVGERIQQTIAEIQKIKEITAANDIELIVFINPINLLTYCGNNLAEFDEFKRELANITDFYDFSGVNDITKNNYYYYETSHYRPMVGDMIVQRIFEMPKEEGECFGTWVTKENVNAHIMKLNEEISDYGMR